MDRSKLIDIIEKQGFSVVLMCIMVYYLWTEQQVMQKDIKDCNNAIIELYRNDHLTMRQLIGEVNQSLKNCNLKQ